MGESGWVFVVASYKHMGKKIDFKNDKFRKERGGYSRWLELHCEKCKQPLALYQKDGPGILKRIYLDRLQLRDDQAIAAGPKAALACKKCKTVLGVPTIYEKEKRPAFRLFAGAVGKKIIKGNKMTS